VLVNHRTAPLTWTVTVDNTYAISSFTLTAYAECLQLS
jgi:hypothetical protein